MRHNIWGYTQRPKHAKWLENRPRFSRNTSVFLTPVFSTSRLLRHELRRWRRTADYCDGISARLSRLFVDWSHAWSLSRGGVLVDRSLQNVADAAWYTTPSLNIVVFWCFFAYDFLDNLSISNEHSSEAVATKKKVGFGLLTLKRWIFIFCCCVLRSQKSLFALVLQSHYICELCLYLLQLIRYVWLQ